MAEKNAGGWQAFALDFDLAAQAESFEGAKLKLESMIESYVHDALIGEDRQYAGEFLRRRAPLSLWLKYWWGKHARKASGANRRHASYSESLPLIPRHPQSEAARA